MSSSTNQGIAVKAITESIEARERGVRVKVPEVATFYLRRGGQSAWSVAIREATEEIIGREFSFNEIDPRQTEEIAALACANYLVAGWDDLIDADGNEVPYSMVNARNLLLPEANYNLVELLIKLASMPDTFLASVVELEANHIKK